jgi:hypothetical protein
MGSAVLQEDFAALQTATARRDGKYLSPYYIEYSFAYLLIVRKVLAYASKMRYY